MEITFSVGIVGKPNVGKSTFFCAATRNPVDIASYPFTTIKPNRGIGYLRTKCVCQEFNVEDNPRNSLCIHGERLIPTELIDTAGLVPDAWKGRGLGNQFLDEIRKADALINIVDASGSTDLEGKILKPGAHDPVEDIHFLEREIIMWLSQILKKDWSKILRNVDSAKGDLFSVLEERLSGLSINRRHLVQTVKKCGLNPEKPATWSDEEFYNFVDVLRAVSKPMLIAANKIDVPTAEENMARIKDLGYITVPCSAEAELALRRAAEKGFIKYLSGDPDFSLSEPEKMSEIQKKALESIHHKVLRAYGSTGVQESINTAFFNLLKMIVVYTVEDPEKLSDHEGRVLPDARLIPKGTKAKDLAYIIHSELGKSFIHAIDARTKIRKGEEYELENGDVITVVCAAKRT